MKKVSKLYCCYNPLRDMGHICPIAFSSNFQKYSTVEGLKFMTLATGDMKRTKRSGPKTEPWGTPVHVVASGEDDESILTKEVRLVR